MTGGCYEVDQTFDNLSVSGSTAVIPGPGPVQSTSTVDLQGSDNFGAVTTPWLVSAAFSPGTVADWQATGLGHVDGRINFTVNAQGDNLDPPTPGDAIQIFAATLQVLSALTGTYRLDQIIVTETLCAGTGPCSAPDTATLIAAYITSWQSSTAQIRSAVSSISLTTRKRRSRSTFVLIGTALAGARLLRSCQRNAAI